MTTTNISLQQPPPPTTTITNCHNDNNDRQDNGQDSRCIHISSPGYVFFMFYVLISYFTDIYYLQIYYKRRAAKLPEEWPRMDHRHPQWGQWSTRTMIITLPHHLPLTMVLRTPTGRQQWQMTGGDNERQGRPAMTRTGPNDMSGIVWALGMSFFFSLCFFIY